MSADVYILDPARIDDVVLGDASLAMPTARFSRERLPEWVGALAATVVVVDSAFASGERDDGR